MLARIVIESRDDCNRKSLQRKCVLRQLNPGRTCMSRKRRLMMWTDSNQIMNRDEVGAWGTCEMLIIPLWFSVR